MPYYYGMDGTYILVLIGAVICMIASARVKSTFAKYARVRSARGITGAEAAQRILEQNGIRDVSVEHIRGELTDHYDPRSKVLRLSDSVYGSDSVAAIGVAAHECGHALQHNKGYFPLTFRSILVPAANLGSKLGIPLIIIGFILGLGGVGSVLAQIGVWVFSLAVLFQIVTLPVEFNASSRALKMLEGYGILGNEELRGASKVLKAAALTYVAAAASSVLQLMRFLILIGGRGSRRRD